jgi:hypothetical protein
MDAERPQQQHTDGSAEPEGGISNTSVGPDPQHPDDDATEEMELSGGSGDEGDEHVVEELMKEADTLLASPSSLKEKTKNCDKNRSRSTGITDLVDKIKLKTGSKGSDSVFGDDDGGGTGAGNGAGAESGSGSGTGAESAATTVAMPPPNTIDLGDKTNNPDSLPGAGAGTGTGGVRAAGTSAGNVNLVAGSTPGDPYAQNNTSARIQSGSRQTKGGPVNTAGKSDYCNHQHSFPAAYSNVRKSRLNSVPVKELQTIDGNRRKQAVCVKPLPGFEIAGDDRQYSVSNFHIPTMKKNVSASIQRKESGLYCVTCKNQHDFSGPEPFVLIISDQNFPPALPTDEKRCCVVIRLEDCYLNELPGLLKEFFGNRSGYLPEGSLLLFGSLSHLASRGLESYAEEVVKIFRVFSNMLSRGCSLSHSISVPLGGVDGEGLVRDLYDLDCWLKSGAVSTFLSLPNSRSSFWKVIRDENGTLATTSERTLFLPESYSNSKKIKFISSNVSDQIPNKIKPLTPNGEKTIISSLMTEIAEIYGIPIEKEPCLLRCSGDQNTGITSGNGRIVIIGASHTGRMVGGLAECNQQTINLTKPGWIANSDSIAELKQKLHQHNIGPDDIIVLDPLSNSIFSGTDSVGNPVDPVKINGKYHIFGQLSIRSKVFIKTTLSKFGFLADEYAENKLIVLMPIPRYVAGRCCSDPEHVSNFKDPSFESDLNSDMEMVEDLLTGWLQSFCNNGAIIHFRTSADNPEVPLNELTVNGSAMWPSDDPVHCTEATYRALTMATVAAIEELSAGNGGGSDETEPAPKRSRLESVVVMRENAQSSKQAAAPAPQSWSSGVLPSRPARGRGGSNGRGGQSGANAWPRARDFYQYGGRRFSRGGRRGRYAY